VVYSIAKVKVKDRLIYYSGLVGPGGDRLTTLFRFQTKPNSDYPQIYRPHDSLLNHKSRLLREAKLWLSDIISPENILEIQHILVCHDVQELMDGDVSRFMEVGEGQTVGTNQLLLPEDIVRYKDFITAQNFLEKGIGVLPSTPHSIIARILDTIDGNYFAFALLANYATKVGGETPDPNLQTSLDRSYSYVNKVRAKYKNKITSVAREYGVDLPTILDHLQQIEWEMLDKFSRVIGKQGYRVTEII